MGKRTRFLLLILPVISAFFFLSNFQKKKIITSLFSGTERHTKLKLDMHMGKGLSYCVHHPQAARIYLFLYFSSFFCLSNWQRLKTCFYKLFQHTSDGYGRRYMSFAHSLLYLSIYQMKSVIINNNSSGSKSTLIEENGQLKTLKVGFSKKKNKKKNLKLYIYMRHMMDYMCHMSLDWRIKNQCHGCSRLQKDLRHHHPVQRGPEQCNINWATSWQNQQCGCARSEDSDLPRHPSSLIGVFALRSMGS